ncbi:MAG: TerB family tellurite resistance protein [Bacteroidia bacterium]|nr:TerB family tellurite resistance protein [Bacteroidia bacterium]MDW8333441.1 TerB family tellurite resistance protein [Bacteroidia bacterium]
MKTNRSFLDYPEGERFAYFALLAAIASADGRLDEQERRRLQELCREAHMSPEYTAHTLSIAEGTSEYDFRLAIETLRESELRFLAVADMLYIARADGKITPDETSEIEGFCQSLNLNAAQIQTLHRYVEKIIAAKTRGADEDELQSLGEEFKNELTLAQVPGHVFGFSAGMMAGMSAVGTAVGVAAGIVSLPFALTYKGIQNLWKKFKGGK